MHGIFSQIAQISQMLRDECACEVDVGAGLRAAPHAKNHTELLCHSSAQPYVQYVVLSKILLRSYMFKYVVLSKKHRAAICSICCSV